MKIILLVGIACFAILTDGRLTEKTTTTPINTKYIKSTPIVRATRNVFNENISKEDNIQSFEVERPPKTKLRHFFRSKVRADVLRVPRESNENISRNTTEVENTSNKSKVALVKKPIPKFYEFDYDNEFQLNAIKAPMKYADSAEHEDEDFNLNDYDFDVNHDEFVGRGKPLEPRIKAKEVKERQRDQQSEETDTQLSVKPPPIFKIQSKVVIPSAYHQANKKERNNKSKIINRGEARMEEDDYYEDSATKTTIQEKEKKSQNTDNEIVEENEDRKETSARAVRSPWNQNFFVNKIKEKSSALMSKTWAILPIFPQFPGNGYVDDQIPLSNEPMVDPMTSKVFII